MSRFYWYNFFFGWRYTGGTTEHFYITTLGWIVLVVLTLACIFALIARR